ncbi:hypothetical protein BN381_20003 [Candidatus Microthrix parvicella RN1]|uniref:Uncharacterized protein n=1 Tax=Candidatus Neomicrothrix parvicella RN1 TaxID=1229780 RepID=R4YXL6_9ACTN|nr:hypothetical protein BN381_20003 [Candidatus Microthrix parvicella RN1]
MRGLVCPGRVVRRIYQPVKVEPQLVDTKRDRSVDCDLIRADSGSRVGSEGLPL